MSRRQKSSRRSDSSGAKLGKTLLILGGVLVLLLVIGIFVGYLGVRSYLRSDGFRTMVGEQTSKALGTQGEYDFLMWTSNSVYSDAFQAEGGIYKTFQADGVRADVDFSSWRRSAWEVTDVTVNKLTVTMAPGSKRDSADSLEESNVSDSSAKGGGFLSGMLPSRTNLGGVEVNQAYLSVDPEGQRGMLPMEIRGAKILLKPVDAGSGWAIDASGGRGSVGKHKVKIGHLKTRYSENEVFITDSRLTLHDNAQLEATGDVELSGRREVDMQFILTDMEVGNVLPKRWLHKVTGAVAAKADLRGSMEKDLVLEGDFILKGGVLKALPVLDTIVRHTGVESFRTLVLNKARFHFRKQGNRLEITELFVESNNLLRIQGAFTVIDEALDGSLNVGVAPGKLRRLPGAESAVFNQERDGFRWATVQLGGTVDAPSEDLSSRLKAAVLPALIEEASATAVETVEDLTGITTDAIDSTKETTEKILDGASKTLEGVLKMTPLFGN